MIEHWFNNDIEQRLGIAHRVVVCDANGDGAFLIDKLSSGLFVTTVGSEIEEIVARYEAEKHYRDKDVVFYVAMPKENLKFLLEYAETGGLIDLTDMEQYIKGHLFATSGTNAIIDGKKLVMAAKLSMGKDMNWWKGVATGIIEPFNLHDHIIDFICSPAEHLQEMDGAVRKVFTEEFYNFIGKPMTAQKPNVMAGEMMISIFNGLINNDISNALLKIYYSLTDKSSAREVLASYIEGYILPTGYSPFSVHPDHPFVEVDKKLTEALSEAIKDGNDLSSYLHVIHERIKSKNAAGYKAEWLKDLVTLFDFEANALHTIISLDALAKYYQTEFCKLDSAMRHLYVAWLNKPEKLRPIQDYYEQLVKILLDKWYSFISDYRPSQQGLIANALQNAGKMAVIVGDGLRLEIAEEVAEGFKSSMEKEIAFSELPSITECGMSALYGCEVVETSAQARFARLKKMVNGVEILPLDNLNESVTAEKLVLTFGDIDQVGEKKQLAGLKDISNYQELLAGKIKELLSMGYNKVYLTTDHGFTITGILDEADKIPAPFGTDLKVDERFILSNDIISGSNLIKRKDLFNGYAYQYYAKSDKPFVTRGAYGYSHGGLTPQECIIPMYCFSNDKKTEEGCKVSIINKKDIATVTGNYFTLKLKAEGDAASLFASSRKIKLQMFDMQGKTITSSIEELNANSLFMKEMELNTAPCKLVVIDFQTTEQLDYCVIDRSYARDIDDLF